MTQLTPEHFELHDSNKAKRFEQRKKEKQERQDLFFKFFNEVNLLHIGYSEANNKDINHVYINKGIELIKLYASKL